MVVRYLVVAGLVATASLAQAGVLETSSPSAPRPAWSFGATPMPASIDPSQPLMQNGPGTWATYGRYGDRGGIATKTLFTGFGPSAANFAAAAPVAPAAPAPVAPSAPAPTPQINADKPAAGGAFTGGPADTPALGNDGVTGGPSAPPPFTDVALGHEQAEPEPVSVPLPPASDIVDVIVQTPAAVSPDVSAPSPAASLVPEPATGMLMLAGMLGAGALSRRRRQ